MTKSLAAARFCAAIFLFIPDSRAADIFVSTNIQAAINAASPGDVIHLAPGRYPEMLTITKSLSLIGSGTNCIIYYTPTNYVPLISITSPATVSFSNFQINGGSYQSWHTPDDWYFGFSSLGIQSTNASLTMNSVVMNRINNFYVTITGGSLFATNVAIWTENVDFPCDVGFELNSCIAIFDGLTQDAGHIDHTININNPPATFSDVTVVNCRIRASRADYGNCIRTYCNSRLVVTNCYLYRGTGTNESPVSFASAWMHNAVSVNGYTNNVLIAGNTISSLPWAINCYGSIGGNQVRIENNSIVNSIFGGVSLDWIWYDCVDLGGGAFGSRGGNVFSESPAPSTNLCADVYYTNTSARHPLAHVFALHNTWSNPANKEVVIWDKLDNPDYGRVITDDLQMKAPGVDEAGRLIISWNERGAGESYTVETCGDLGSGSWTNALGSWPILNPGLGDMAWTNSSTAPPAAFYRIRSVIP